MPRAFLRAVIGYIFAMDLFGESCGFIVFVSLLYCKDDTLQGVTRAVELNFWGSRRSMENLLKELLRIREEKIPHRENRLDWKNAIGGKPGFPGVYAFWWNGSPDSFFRRIGNRTLHFHGPGGKQLSWELRQSDLRVADNGLIPLYVGKNASDISKRIGLHLKLKTPRTVAARAVGGICRRMTTSCQIRDRLDRLFPQSSDTRQLAVENLALSYVRIEGDAAFVKRFFFEDLAIGCLRPLFNVDSER